MQDTKTIAETSNFIVLDKYEKIDQSDAPHQSEAALENEFIADLVAQGYEYAKHITKPDALLANLRIQIERLNSSINRSNNPNETMTKNIKFTDEEWQELLDTFIDAPNDDIIEKSRKIHDNYIKDFTFKNGQVENIYLLDKNNILNNKLQVINQFEQTGTQPNRYDVTILVNGLPLVHIELKKRGVAIQEAFNQIHRYSKESFNGEHSLFKFIQIFVISNGTETLYFANTTKREKQFFDFTIKWARSNNEIIDDLKDFTCTFFQKNTLLSILIKYCVFNADDVLLIMRPYQIAAAERIISKIETSHKNNIYSKPEAGGYIWHTTGSGKTLTSFKAARLATKLDFIKKVFFVVDRKDLDFQTQREYEKFSEGSILGSTSTRNLIKNMNINSDKNKIVVTTIQKLQIALAKEKDLPIYNEEVVFIFDEAHRSQFGEAQKLLKQRFKKYYQFGFTGTPIFEENSSSANTTGSVFGIQLHSYIITHAIKDHKVLKFKVDYNDVRPEFKNIESETNDEKIAELELSKQAFLHPKRIEQVANYILDNFNIKTARTPNRTGIPMFNAMFAVSSVQAAKQYYQAFKEIQADENYSGPKLKIATIFSYAANEAQNAIGDIKDESPEADIDAMESSSKEFLLGVINDYNAMFNTNFNLQNFAQYHSDLSKKVIDRKIDLLIVVGMFLTGFDAPHLNTLFVDRDLKYHGLIQAYSRTNRILNSEKIFGNIVAFRNLEKATIDAIELFGDSKTRNTILEKNFMEYIKGFEDTRGYIEIVNEINTKFSNPSAIQTEEQKQEFVQLYNELLRMENIVRNYDENTCMRELQALPTDIDAEQRFQMEKQLQAKYCLDDEKFTTLKNMPAIKQRLQQDLQSKYNDIRLERIQAAQTQEKQKTASIWDDVVFEIELLKSKEIDLPYILEIVANKKKENQSKENIIEEIKRLIRSTLDLRSKEDLIENYLENNLDEISETTDVLEDFYEYARDVQNVEVKQLIDEENLNQDAALRYIKDSLKAGYASDIGMALGDALPPISPLDPNSLTLKSRVLGKIKTFVDKFKGIGGELEYLDE